MPGLKNRIADPDFIVGNPFRRFAPFRPFRLSLNRRFRLRPRNFSCVFPARNSKCFPEIRAHYQVFIFYCFYFFTSVLISFL